MILCSLTIDDEELKSLAIDTYTGTLNGSQEKSMTNHLK